MNLESWDGFVENHKDFIPTKPSFTYSTYWYTDIKLKVINTVKYVLHNSTGIHTIYNSCTVFMCINFGLFLMVLP